jgi:iron complex transport system substrate-binding protein
MTEIVFALGAGDRVVGDTRFCNFPPEAAQREKVGGYTDVSLEKVLSLKPDLVAVPTGPGAAAVARALEKAGVRVYWSRVDDIDDTLRTIRELGGLLGLAPRAAEVAGALERELVAEAPRGEAPRVLVLVGAHPLVAAGPGTYLDELVRRAGGKNVVTSNPGSFASLSEEAVAALAPTVILDLAMAGERLPASLLERWAASGVRVVPLKGDWYLRPGPRLGQAFRDVRAALVVPPR